MLLSDEAGYSHFLQQTTIRTYIYLAVATFIITGIISIFFFGGLITSKGSTDEKKNEEEAKKKDIEPPYVPILFVCIVLAWCWTLYDPSGMDPDGTH